MNKKLNEQIAAALPELRTALQNPEENISVGGVVISRDDAEKMCKAFEDFSDSDKKIPWQIIPLSLATSNIHYRGIQEELNSIYLSDDGR